MHIPCRALFNRLLIVADNGNVDAAKKVFNVLIECNDRRDCSKRDACKADVNQAFLRNGLDVPFKELATDHHL